MSASRAALTAFVASCTIMGCHGADRRAPTPAYPRSRSAGFLEISLAHGSPREAQAREQLQRLLEAYDLSPWVYTRKVVIDGDPNTIPHSHPVLTLHTRHLQDDDLLLSTFLHEQAHWVDDASMASAVTDLKAHFKNVPVGYPDGARDERSSYEHLAVIWLEYDALAANIGEQRAGAVMWFWQDDHYRELYKLVYAKPNRSIIGSIVAKHIRVPKRP